MKLGSETPGVSPRSTGGGDTSILGLVREGFTMSHAYSGLHPPSFPWTTKGLCPSPTLQMAGTQLGPVGGRKGNGHRINMMSFVRLVEHGFLFP